MAEMPREIRVGGEPLSWSEVADAVWLAAALRRPSAQPDDELDQTPRLRIRHPSCRHHRSVSQTPGRAPGRPRGPNLWPGGNGTVLPGVSRGSATGATVRGRRGRAPKPGTMPGGPDILRSLRPLKRLRPST